MSSSTHGKVIDHEVLTQRRARRAREAELQSVQSAETSANTLLLLESRVDELQQLLKEMAGGHGAGQLRLERNLADIKQTATSVAKIHIADEINLKAALKSARSAAANLRSQTWNWRIRLRSLEVGRAATAVRLAVLESEHSVATRSSSAAKAALTRQAEALEIERNKVRRQIAAAATERNKAETLRSEVQNQRKRHLDVLLRLQQASREANDKLQKREEKIARLRQELELAQSQVESRSLEQEMKDQSLLVQVAQLERRVQVISGELEMARSAANTANVQIKAADIARQVLDVELGKLRELTESLSAQLLEERHAKKQALMLTNQRETEVADLVAQLAEVKDELQQSRSSADDQRLQVIKNQGQLRVVKEERDRKALELSELKFEVSQLRRQAIPEPNQSDQAEPDVSTEPQVSKLVEIAALAKQIGPQLRKKQLVSRSFEQFVADLDKAASALRRSVMTQPDHGSNHSNSESESNKPQRVQDEPNADVAGIEKRRETQPEDGVAKGLLRDRPLNENASTPTNHSAEKSKTEISTNKVSLRQILATTLQSNPDLGLNLLFSLAPGYHTIAGRNDNFDICINGHKSYSLRSDRLSSGLIATSLLGKREKRNRDFRLSIDTNSLASLLAGENIKVRRFRGPIRISGKRRVFEQVRLSLAGSKTGFSQLISQGVRPEFDDLIAVFPHFIDPSQTTGLNFMVEFSLIEKENSNGVKTISAWEISVTSGQAVSVKKCHINSNNQNAQNESTSAAHTKIDDTSQNPNEFDAFVEMTRTGLYEFLAGEKTLPKNRPTIKGNRDAVEQLRLWIQVALG